MPARPLDKRQLVVALRRARMLRARGEFGSGVACDLCRVMIWPTDLEFEVQAELDGERLELHFHPRCYDSWRAAALSATEDDPTTGR